MEQLRITSQGVKTALEEYDYKKAIAEFIWNGFDAGATCVQLVYSVDEIGRLSSLQIVDNGYGIPKEKLADKFAPIFESDKAIGSKLQRNTSAAHGKNGVGRLTFFTFAEEASWRTSYQADDIRLTYTIHINAASLQNYNSGNPVPTTDTVGTAVTFLGIRTISEHSFKSEIKKHLIREFCWYLELNSHKDYTILLNGERLDYSSNIGDKYSFEYEHTKITFHIEYIRWNENLNSEFSRYYYIDENDEEKYKETTKLNYQGDKFYHSIFIRSSYFNGLQRPSRMTDTDEPPSDSLAGKRSDKIFRDLMTHILLFLRDKRKPFLAESTNRLIDEFKKERVFPDYGQSEWDRVRRMELEITVRSLYQYEPRIFINLNTEQKKIITHLLDLIIDADERDRLIEIISGIVQLTREERKEFAQVLHISRMANVVKTMKLIEGRYRAVEHLKELVFNRSLNANERDHVQKYVEQHYWIFGEQYHLVTAAEPKFEEALRRFIYLLRGEEKPVAISHPDKQKEMDIFMVRKLIHHDTVNCTVVELKSPVVRLGEKELNQVKKYWRVIKEQPDFNAPNNTWEFYLVGNEFDGTGAIQGEIDNAKQHGEKSLAYRVDNCKIYVKTWSEIFNEFEIRHKFLMDKLELDRAKMESNIFSAADIVTAASSNGAAQPGQITLPRQQ
jgi:hypothetical protein